MIPNQNKLVAFYVARHGQTSLNSQNCFRGSANPPLDSTGLKQAKKLSDLFSDVDLSCIVCSDKQRATKTAEIIASSKKEVPVHSSEQLRALNIGSFSGTKRTKEAEAELQQYIDNPNTRIPGGESLNEFKNRILPCFQEAIDIYVNSGLPPLIVGHSSIVHELGSVTTGNHKGVLVHPGGIAMAYFEDGKLKSKPVFRPIEGGPTGERAETIS